MRRSMMACAVAAGLAASVLAVPAGASTGTDGWQLALTVHAPTTHPASQWLMMTSISAPSADDVWTIGAVQPANDSAPDRPVLEHWNGHVWTQVAMPGSFTAGDGFQVVAVSSTDVWVFNSSDKAQGRFAEKPMWARWNGRAWTTGSLVVPALTAGGFIDITAAVAIGPDDIWVGGRATSEYFSAQSADEPFLVNYNGKSWRMYPFPRTANAISGISALGPADVWASGSADSGVNDEVNRLLHWNGRSWQSIRIPASLNGSPGGADFSDVVAESPHSALVAGLMPWGGRNSGYYIPGVAYWNGTRWTTTTIPASLAKAEQLTNQLPLIAAVSDGSGGIWMVSQFTSGSDGQNPPGQMWHYAHGRWSSVPEPGITGWDTVLALTSTPGTDEAWAAGYTLKTRPGSGLVFRYNVSR